MFYFFSLTVSSACIQHNSYKTIFCYSRRKLKMENYMRVYSFTVWYASFKLMQPQVLFIFWFSQQRYKLHERNLLFLENSSNRLVFKSSWKIKLTISIASNKQENLRRYVNTSKILFFIMERKFKAVKFISFFFNFPSSGSCSVNSVIFLLYEYIFIRKFS